MGTQPPPPLDYENRKTARRAALIRIARLMLVIGVVLFVSFTISGVGRLMWRNYRAYQIEADFQKYEAQWRVRIEDSMNYVAAPTRVIYEENPVEGAMLLRLGGYGQPGMRPYRDPAVYWVSPSWLVSAPGYSVLFSHRLTAAPGLERLVGIGIYERMLWVYSMDVAPPNLRPKVVSQFVLRVHPDSGPNELRIFAGQVDPSDNSHFTIDYVLAGQRGTIDGRLGVDDKVRLTPRTGSLSTNNKPDEWWWVSWTPPEAGASSRPTP